MESFKCNNKKQEFFGITCYRRAVDFHCFGIHSHPFQWCYLCLVYLYIKYHINLSAILHLEICFISFLFSFPWKFNIVCIIETNKMKKRNVLKLNRKGNTQNMFQFNLLFKCYEIVQFYRFNNIQWDLNQLHTIFLLIKAMFKSVKLICFISGTK